MAKNSHIPKFGNWDNDNVPYTAFFENARKEKAFMWGTVGLEIDGDGQPVPPPRRVDSSKCISAEKHHIEEHMGHNPRGINSFDRKKSSSRRSTTSEFGSDKSNSEHSLSQSGHRRLKSDRKKGLGEGSNSFSPAVPPGYSRQRSETYPSDESHHRAASIPRFGAWDETDPRSGEGFTVIFNKVKEEKQIASTQIPVVPEQTNNCSHGQSSNEGYSFRSKICCCLFSRERD